uniref:Triadin n=1 Tax=Echeneis naucrates TaxID=173247 RepID=A0A665V9F4_ECHNA
RTEGPYFIRYWPNGDAGSPSARTPKKTFTDELYSTFSSPLAWILVLALIITWSCVFVIMFDLMDYKTISGITPSHEHFPSLCLILLSLIQPGHPSHGVRKVLKDSEHRGGLTKIGSDPVKAVNDAVEGSANVITAILKFAASLVAPEEDEGFHVYIGFITVTVKLAISSFFS